MVYIHVYMQVDMLMGILRKLGRPDLAVELKKRGCGEYVPNAEGEFIPR